MKLQSSFEYVLILGTAALLTLSVGNVFIESAGYIVSEIQGTQPGSVQTVGVSGSTSIAPQQSVSTVTSSTGSKINIQTFIDELPLIKPPTVPSCTDECNPYLFYIAELCCSDIDGDGCTELYECPPGWRRPYEPPETNIPDENTEEPTKPPELNTIDDNTIVQPPEEPAQSPESGTEFNRPYSGIMQGQVRTPDEESGGVPGDTWPSESGPPNLNYNPETAQPGPAPQQDMNQVAENVAQTVLGSSSSSGTSSSSSSAGSPSNAATGNRVNGWIPTTTPVTRTTWP